MADDRQGSGFSWFLLGLGIGAAVGVLYAPKAGSDMRDELREQAREGGEYLKRRSREAADQMNELIETGKGQLNDYVGKSKEAVDRGRQVVQEQAGKVSAAVDAGKHAYKTTTAGEDL